MELSEKLYENLKRWLEEDIPFWDLTTATLNINGEADFTIIAKTEVYSCCTELLEEALRKMGLEARFERGWVRGKLAEIHGEASKILMLERSLLNFLIHVFSISTEVRKVREVIDKSEFSKVRLAVTRKTVPGMRLWAKLFASCAGADTHRLSLSDMIMIKDTHADFVGDLEKAVKISYARKSFAHKIEVEVRRLEDIDKVIDYIDIIMLDNFLPEEAKKASCYIKKKNPNVIVEVSGGINKENVLLYLNECVDVVSMGYLTISPPRVDLSMRYRG